MTIDLDQLVSDCQAALREDRPQIALKATGEHPTASSAPAPAATTTPATYR